MYNHVQQIQQQQRWGRYKIYNKTKSKIDALPVNPKFAVITFFSKTTIRKTIIQLTVFGHFCELRAVVLEEVSDQNSF